MRYRIICTGVWQPGLVHAVLDPEMHRLPEPHESHARAHWERLVAENPTLYNGTLAALDEWQSSENALRLRLSITDYRHLVYANANAQALREEGRANLLPRALGISAMLVTADRRLLLVHRSPHVGEYPDLLDVPGGHIHPDEAQQAPGEIDVFAAIQAEVMEELGLSPRLLENPRCIGLVENGESSKPELVFSFLVRCNEEEVHRRAASAKDRFEYTALKSIEATPPVILAFLDDHGARLTPSAEGCLALFTEMRDSDQ